MNYETLFSRGADTMRQSPIRQMGTVAAQRADLISFAPGYPGADIFAWDDYRAIADDLLRGRGADVLQYGPTHGFRPLVDVLIEILKARGIGTASHDTTLVTTGSQQGLDLVSRTLLDPGDVVLLELPSYTGAIAAFRNTRAVLVGVKQQPDGIDLDDLQEVLQRVRQEGRRVKFLYVTPNFQNPSGSLMSLEKRLRLLEWAGREGVPIVEDDPYGDLYFEDAATAAETRPIKADDRDDSVIYLTSFSKTLAPAFRVAWVAAPASVVAKFDVAKQAADLCTGNFDQHIVYEACVRGVLARRIPELRRYYQHKRTVMERALTRELQGLVTWPIPRGGFFLWAALPQEMDSQVLLQRAMNHGVIFVAGGAFFVDGSGRYFVRLSFSQQTPERIEDGIARLAAAIKEEHAALQPGTARSA